MTKKKRLLWQLYGSYLLITLVSLVAITWYAARFFRQFHLDQTAADLAARALLLEKQISNFLDPLDENAIDRLCKEAGKSAATRITVILASGEVIGDSKEAPSVMDSHSDRPEVMQALSGSRGVSRRFSRTLGLNMLYVALPLMRDNRPAAVIRTAIPLQSFNTVVKDIRIRVAFGGLVIALLAAGLSFWVSSRITRPIEQMRRWAYSIAKGDFQSKAPWTSSRELDALSETMGQMALQLKQRIDTILWQRKEIEVILASMLEGVIAVDREERVIRLNPAAARMFGYSPLDSQGKNIEEVFRNPKLHDFVRDTLESAEPLERDINIASGEERFLTAHGTQLQDGEARKVGALIVLNDVTRLKRLENMRRDFVANVSHEIKTPITAIKGFAETLSSGTVKEKEDVARFLAIIEKHANRLQAIVEDLLSLSRIEQQQEKQDIDFSETVLKDVLLTAIQICQPGAETRQIKIELSCPDDLSAEINSPLLEQALVNLLDNAIKYSYEKGCVRLEVSEGKEDAVIRARDEGYGIAKKDLPCLFERFYRVDQGRSRRMGGTGLGLAIVKHISEAHGGWLTVESEIGQGSTFAIHLPKLQKRRNIGARAADLRAGERLEKGRFWV